MFPLPEPRSTAVTDALLFALALGIAIHLRHHGRREPWKRGLWTGTFCLTALSAGLGGVMHGFSLGPATEGLLWSVLSATGGLAVGMLAVGMIYDRWGPAPARRALPIVGITAAVFYATRIGADGGGRVPFQLYAAAATIVALAGYAWMAWKRGFPGSIPMSAGILLVLGGVAVHLRPGMSLTVIWPFDHNGICHVIQMAGLLTMTAGLRESFQHHGP